MKAVFNHNCLIRKNNFQGHHCFKMLKNKNKQTVRLCMYNNFYNMRLLRFVFKLFSKWKTAIKLLMFTAYSFTHIS